jgi:pantothenate kinase-related protein Tda10
MLEDQNERVIILVCGIPGSGKSTLARLIFQAYHDIQKSSLILSFDDFEDPRGSEITPFVITEFSQSIGQS